MCDQKLPPIYIKITSVIFFYLDYTSVVPGIENCFNLQLSLSFWLFLKRDDVGIDFKLITFYTVSLEIMLDLRFFLTYSSTSVHNRSHSFFKRVENLTFF